jgi:hypothetical protein
VGSNGKTALQGCYTHSKESLRLLDARYKTVLKKINMDDPSADNNFRTVMGQVLGVFEPLSIAALNRVRRCSPDKSGRTSVSSVVNHMGSVLRNVTSGSDYPISPSHTSFREFLIDPDRSGKFCVNLDTARGHLAAATVQTMNKMLHFNMCKLETSYRLNSEVRDLDERIAKRIPSALSYSCRFWAKHLAHASDRQLFSSLQVFIEQKLLFWLEVLSVTKEVPMAPTALSLLSGWLRQMRDQVSISEFCFLMQLHNGKIRFKMTD